MHLINIFSRLLLAALLTFAIPTTLKGAIPAGMGRKVTTFQKDVVRLEADPVRPRIYAITRTNELVVIDTSTLKVIKTIGVGSSPSRLAVAPDASVLFVVNSGSTTSGVTIIDLQTLTVAGSKATPHLCFDIAAASATRIFLSPVDGYDDPLIEMEVPGGTTKSLETDGFLYYSAHIALTPDGKTLIVGNDGLSPSSLIRFDATTSPPTQSEFSIDAGSNGQDLIMSHFGKGFIFPCGGGNSDTGYAIALFDCGNLTQQFGAFVTDAYPRNGAFSIDDRFFFTLPDSQTDVQVWNAETFVREGTFPVVDVDGFDHLVCDTSGRYLFTVEQTDYTFDAPRQIGVYATGLKPFTALAGNYIFSSPVATADGFPIMNFTLAASGAFSGTLRDRGRSYAFKGTLAWEPSHDFSFTRPDGLPPLIVRVGATIEAGEKELYGILNPDAEGVDLSVLKRKVFPKTNPAPQAGRYTTLLPVGDTEALGLGVGYGSFSVSKGGGVVGAGVLGDGTAFALSAAILDGDYVVLNVPLYRKKGALGGLLRFRDAAGISDLDGIVSWIRPATTSLFNPAGFSVTRSWQAARYVPPVSGTNVFAFTSAELSLEADHLTPIDPVAITLGLNNSLTPGTNSVGLLATLSAKTGVFRGSFLVPGNPKPIKWKGVVQSKRQRAEGLFKTAVEFGTATLQ
jgi:YVTN family beta-propeller protein